MQIKPAKGSPKLLNAWAFYDWANSVYSLTIASAIFPIYYELLFKDRSSTVEFLGFSFKNSALISFVTAAAFLVVAFLSPLLSGIADYTGNKKIFMKTFNYIGALACVGLAWFEMETFYWGVVCYFLGLLGFWGSLVFYNSYLPDIAFPEQQDAISAKGYSLGYIGSVVLLILNLVMVMFPETFGISAWTAMKLSFVSVGVWWIGFSQYSYYYLPKGAGKGNRITREVLSSGFRELRKVAGELGSNLRLKRYLTAFFVYSMAVQTVMLVATYFGAQEIQWESDEQSSQGLIICILLIQFLAVAGAFLTSYCSSKIGNVYTLIVLNISWILICVSAYFVYSPLAFYCMASCVGLVMGGIQSLSRSTYSKFLPDTTDTTSYFSFYDVAEKIGIVIGMLLYGLIDQITGSARNAVFFLTVFFIMGFILLLRVPKEQPMVKKN